MKTSKKYKTPVWMTLVYVIGIAVCVGCYVFSSASGYLIPGASPLALAAVIGLYTYQHYQENKERRDGMLKPQMIILGFIISVNVFFGILQIYAAIVS